MAKPSLSIVPLSEMAADQEADLFVMMTSKEELKTRDGKPYYRVGFRDAKREVNFPIWGDSAWAVDCREQWMPGVFYKMRATLRESNYGPQLEIRKIREATDADRDDGFDPTMLQASSRYDPVEMFDELVGITEERIEAEPLRRLVAGILQAHRETLLTLPAATRNHHAYIAGYLEHVLSVTRTAVFLADKYADYYTDLQPPLNTDLVIAGAVLHDIGKLRELRQNPQGAEYTAEGDMIGHILQGRDMVREAAAETDLDAESLLRLEHIIVSHQRLPEWGSPKPPMTPEALIVHYADDLDAKYHMMYMILRDDASDGPLTSRKNVLGQKVFRGGDL
jgi:3'-5' exoribonuclease